MDIAAPRHAENQDRLLRAAIEETSLAIGQLTDLRRILVELHRRNAALRRRHRSGNRSPTDDAWTNPPPLRFAGMTVAEAADVLGLSEEHVRRLLRRGDLQGVAYGGRIGWRLAREYIERLAERQS